MDNYDSLKRRSKSHRRSIELFETRSSSSHGSDDLQPIGNRRRSSKSRRRSDVLDLQVQKSTQDPASGLSILADFGPEAGRDGVTRHHKQKYRRRSARPVSNPDHYPDLVIHAESAAGHRSRSSQGSVGSDGSTDSSYSRQKGQEELAGLYLNTKASMLEVIEADLQLKLEMRSIKEQFLRLLENFTQFEHCSMDPGDNYYIATSRNNIYGSTKYHLSGYDAPEVSMCSPTTDSTTEVYNRQETRLKSSRSTAMMSAFYPFRSLRPRSKKKKNYEEHNLTNISDITKCSETSIREQNSRYGDSGPLQSTFQYPQHSTPEKKVDQSISSALDEQSAVHKLTLLDGTQRTIANRIDSRLELPSSNTTEVRPVPTGLDNAHFDKFPQSAAAQALLEKSPTRGDTTTPDNNTPIIRRALQANPNFNHLVNNSDCSSNSPTLVADDTTPVSSTTWTPKVSRELFLQTEETFSIQNRREHRTSQSSESSNNSSDSDRLQIQNLSDPQQPLTPISTVNLADSTQPHDSTLTSTKMSIEATRASEADTSGLSIIMPSDGNLGDSDRTSDETMSTENFNSCTESSYKESDGQWSPGRSVNTGSCVSMPEPVQLTQKRTGPLSSGTNSLASLNSERAGMRAPVNSPNVTDISTSSKPTTVDSADTSDSVFGKRPVALGSSILASPPNVLGRRPPCIGDEMHTPQSAKALTSLSSLSPPSTVKKRPLKRTSSLTSPKAEPMIVADQRALTDCDTSSDKSVSTSGYTSKSSANISSEVLSNSGSQSGGTKPKGAEGGQSDVQTTPSKKSKRRLSQKLKSLKNRFRRKSIAKNTD